MDEPLNIDLFIFDWSGTISDDRKPVYEANMNVLTDYKIPRISFQEFLDKIKATPAQFLQENYELCVNEAEAFARYTKYYNEEIARGNIPTVYKNAESVLLYLYNREKPLAVLSSHPEQNLKQEAASYDLLRYFDLLVGNAGTNGKAGGLLDICIKLGKKPGSALYIGDTVHDIRAANNVGIYSAGVCGGYTSREELEREEPDFILPDLNRLERLFLVGKLQ